MALSVSLVSPEAIIYEGEAIFVSCRSTDGDIAFQPDHAPYLGALVPGESSVVIRPTSGPDVVATAVGGFVEVKDNRVIILSDAAHLS